MAEKVMDSLVDR